MSDAAKKTKSTNGRCDTIIFDILFSNDGVWQRRGFVSVIGNIVSIFLESG